MRPLHLSCLQPDSVSWDLSSAPPADLVVLPELWRVPYFAFDRYESSALPLREAVAGLGVPGAVTVAGSVLERDGDRIYNTIPVLGPSGELLGSYRKCHLFTYGSREGELLTPGSEVVVIDTPVGRLGLATCFDLRFPTQFGVMRSLGADVLVVPAAWPAARWEHWRVLVQARAIETQTPVVAVNATGTSEGVELAGSSLVVDARGNVVADAGAAPGWLTATLDLDDAVQWRREFPLGEVSPVA